MTHARATMDGRSSRRRESYPDGAPFQAEYFARTVEPNRPQADQPLEIAHAVRRLARQPEREHPVDARRSIAHFPRRHDPIEHPELWDDDAPDHSRCIAAPP